MKLQTFLIIYITTVAALILFYQVRIRKLNVLIRPAMSNNILREILEINHGNNPISETANRIIEVLVDYSGYDIDYCTVLMKSGREMNIVATNIKETNSLSFLEVYAHKLLQDVSCKGNSVSKKMYNADGSVLTYPTAKERGIKCMFFITLMDAGEIIGALLVENKDPEKLRGMESGFFLMVLDNISLVLTRAKDREKLNSLAYLDRLTGVYNRTYMDMYIPEQLELHSRTNSSYSIAVLDIDKFKSFNDTYGHQFGDIVLRTVAQYIRESIRPADAIFRFGGEEFIIFFSRTTNKDIFKRLDEIRHNISHLELSNGKVITNVTVSFGLAEGPRHSASIEGLIEKADQALYEAKRTGRNKVLMYDTLASDIAER